jgi:hypothetical protein
VQVWQGRREGKRGGALRAIDLIGLSAFLADLRSAPPFGNLSLPGGYAGWHRMIKAGVRLRRQA